MMLTTPTPSVTSRDSVPVSKDTLLDQAYHQYCLLEEAGEHIRPEVFLGRYPTIQSSLGRLLELHHGFVEEARQIEASIAWPKVGDRFHGFQLERQLGEGASSRVFLATEPALGKRKVAVKITRQGDSEAYMLGRIKHANVIPIFSRVPIPEQNLSIICMEYLGSETLCSLLDRVLASPKKPSDASIILEAARDRYADVEVAEKSAPRWTAKSYEEGICTFFADICSALEYMHGREILHRDLKPSNILMRPDGSPVLLDFHLASDRQGPSGSFGGTYPYMPPEQLRAMSGNGRTPASAVDERSDLFAVGVLLWETLTGMLPFGTMPRGVPIQDAIAEMLARQQAGFQAPMPQGWSVSSHLVAIVRRCLAADPNDRPSSAAALRRLLVPEWKRPRLSHWLVAASTAMVAAATLWSASMHYAPSREDDVAKRYREGVRFFHAGDHDRARDEFREVTKTRPNDPRGWRALAIALVKDGTTDPSRLADAFNACQWANSFESAPDYAFTGYLLQLRGEPQAAKVQYEFALHNNQAVKAVRNNLSALLCNEGLTVGADVANLSVENAIQRADQVLAEDANCQPALINRALARYKKSLTRTGQPLAAIERENLRVLSLADLNRALEVGPASGELHYKIASVMAFPKINEGDVNGVISHLNAAINLGINLQKESIDGAWSLVRTRPEFRKLLERTPVASTDAKWKRFIAPYDDLPVWER